MFFLLAAAQAVLIVPLWIAVVFGWISLPVGMEVSWHAHQMLYGFVAAGMAGALLRVVPNRAAVPGLRGMPLVTLAGLWLAARALMCLTEMVPPWLPAIVDLAFLPAIAVALIAPLMTVSKPRKLAVLVLLSLFWAGDLLMQAGFLGLADTAGTGARFGIDALLVMLAVIAGERDGRAAALALRPLDAAAMGALGLLLMADTVAESGPLTGGAALLAAVLNGARLARWLGQPRLRASFSRGGLLGYSWLVLGLLLQAAAGFSEFPDVAALHALTVGAIATTLLGVMSRAFDDAGRPLTTHPAMLAAYALVSLAAVLRVGAGVWPQHYAALLTASAIAWSLAFLIYLAVSAPLLCRTASQR